MSGKPTTNEILALETAYWDAMQRKDGDKAASLSGETSLVTGARGVLTIPKAKMGQMTQEGDWTLESYTFDDVEVTVPAEDVAIIAYTVRQKVTMNGQPREMRAADSSTWVRGERGWECHAHSETVLGDQAGA